MTDEDDDQDDLVLCDHLHRDDGHCLGVIMRWYEEGPTYACSKYGRIGACPSDDAARLAVEQALETGGRELAGRVRSTPSAVPG